jgi:hypothetical protein
MISQKYQMKCWESQLEISLFDIKIEILVKTFCSLNFLFVKKNVKMLKCLLFSVYSAYYWAYAQWISLNLMTSSLKISNKNKTLWWNNWFFISLNHFSLKTSLKTFKEKLIIFRNLIFVVKTKVFIDRESKLYHFLCVSKLNHK